MCHGFSKPMINSVNQDMDQLSTGNSGIGVESINCS